MIKCSNPNCAAEIEPGSRFCAHCGTPVPQDKECPKCGAIVPLAANFCGGCGHNFNPPKRGSDSDAVLSIGDKNVIAGDVVGSQENFTITGGTATFIKNEDETKKVIVCSVCGKNIQILDATNCPGCRSKVCPQCFDREHKLCVACIEEREKEKELSYSQQLRQALSDGMISQSERLQLNVLANQLGLSFEKTQALENALRNEGQKEMPSQGLSAFAQVALKNALETLYDEGRLQAAAGALSELRKQFPENEEILTHFLFALVKIAPESANEIISQYPADTPGVYLAKIDMDLQNKDFFAAEKDINAALRLWPGNFQVKCRQVLSLQTMAAKLNEKAFLAQAAAILDSLPLPADKLEYSWLHKVKYAQEFLSGSTLPEITPEYCRQRNLYAFLARPEIKIPRQTQPAPSAFGAAKAAVSTAATPGPEVGKTYSGTVTAILGGNALIEILPGVKGILALSGTKCSKGEVLEVTVTSVSASKIILAKA